MKSKSLSSKILIIFTFLVISTSIGLTFLLITSYFYSKNSFKETASKKINPDNNISDSEQNKKIISNIDIVVQNEMELFFELPAKLKIPVINVDAPVESLGLTEDGNMDTPKGPKNVAWYKFGTIPGETGSAVINGHFGAWKNGSESVFDKLHMLNIGDKIYTEDGNGKTITFIVKKIQIFEPQADASEIFSSNDEKSHLNLITCSGVWNTNSKSYSQRLVVFSDME